MTFFYLAKFQLIHETVCDVHKKCNMLTWKFLYITIQASTTSKCNVECTVQCPPYYQLQYGVTLAWFVSGGRCVTSVQLQHSAFDTPPVMKDCSNASRSFSASVLCLFHGDRIVKSCWINCFSPCSTARAQRLPIAISTSISQLMRFSVWHWTEIVEVCFSRRHLNKPDSDSRL